MRIQDNATATQFSAGVTPLVMRDRTQSASNRIESPPPVDGFFARTLAARAPPSHRHSSEGADGYVRPNSDRRSPHLSDPDDAHALVELRTIELRRPHSLATAEAPFFEEDEVFRSPPTPPQHAYINVVPVPSPSKSTTSARNKSSDLLAGGGAYGRNIPLHGRSVSDGSTSVYTPHKQYVNLREMSKKKGETTPPLLDYAFVNLGTPGPCSPASNCVRSPSLVASLNSSGKHDSTAASHNYARIDLEKTKALEQTANGRRHRHDSSATVASSGVRDVC
jgi:hypothetical protein